MTLRILSRTLTYGAPGDQYAMTYTEEVLVGDKDPATATASVHSRVHCDSEQFKASAQAALRHVWQSAEKSAEAGEAAEELIRRVAQ